MKYIGWILALAISAGTGWLAGELTGASGPHTNVVAAVVPVLISGIGGAIGFKAISGHGNCTDLIWASAFAAVFLVVFIYALHSAVETRQNMAKYKVQQIQEKRMTYLENCSLEQLRLNDGREMLGLPPLKFETVCPPF